MPELSSLQELVLQIIEEHSSHTLFGKGNCLLKNQEIFDLIKDKNMKPSTVNYLSEVLSDLEYKKKIKRVTKSLPRHQGRKRIITIL